MTPEQLIKKEILLIASKEGLWDTFSDGPECEITDKNVDTLYGDFEGLSEDYEEEYRGGDYNTDLQRDDPVFSYFEQKEVARKMSDGRWVGWTYWYGGGNHAYPEEVEWMEYAYFLECTEREVLTTIRDFKKIPA